jgi:hypothetical protein
LKDGILNDSHEVTLQPPYGLGVWGSIFENRRDSLKAALNELMTGLAKSSGENDKYAIIVLKQAKNLFDEITGRKPLQLSLF